VNDCKFIGKIVDKPELQSMAETQVLRFNMVVDKFRKNKMGQKIRDRNCLPFEAWDSGARLINEHYAADDEIFVDCVARISDGQMVFRVNEFKIIPQVETV
jgi:single-stranded DNA-binding protein